MNSTTTSSDEGNFQYPNSFWRWCEQRKKRVKIYIYIYISAKFQVRWETAQTCSTYPAILKFKLYDLYSMTYDFWRRISKKFLCKFLGNAYPCTLYIIYKVIVRFLMGINLLLWKWKDKDKSVFPLLSSWLAGEILLLLTAKEAN